MAAYAAVLILLASAVLMLFFSPAALRTKLDALVPGPVARFFDPPPKPIASAPNQSVAESARAQVKNALPVIESRSLIVVGATKAEVLAIQGEPSSTSASVWRYGQSEIYFKDGRVTHWRSAAGDPLKVR